MSIKHNRHSVGGSNYHLQFTPKYRRLIFEYREIRQYIVRCFRLKAEKLRMKLSSVEFGPDHVHLFVENCKNYSVGQLVQYFKGYSSRMVRKHYWNIVKKLLWGKSFWTGGYFYESIGRVTKEHIKYYIERQQGRHWKKTSDWDDITTLRRLDSSQMRLDVFSLC